MTESDFNRLAAEGYNRIPVTLETFADLDTPLSIYLKLANDPTPTCSSRFRAVSASAAIPSSASPPAPALPWSTAPSCCSPATASPSGATIPTR
jgi:hypothetical protein